jgi:hypothetical protein
MTDPKTALLSFPLDIGVDQNGDQETIQPFGDRPRLVSSVNTRLTATRGRVSKAPARTTLLAGVRRCGGIVPSRGYDSAVAFFHPADGSNRRIARGSVGLLPAVWNGTSDQNSYYPLRVARAGALPNGAAAVVGPAVGHDPSTGYTYFATLGDTISGGVSVSYIAITVLGGNGELVVAPKRVVLYSTAIADPFLAITAFSGQVTLWYKSTSTNAILAARLTVTGLTVALGASTTIYTPGSIALGSAALAYDQADTSNVYIVCYQSASNNARLLRVNPTTFAVSTGLDVTTGADAAAKHAIAYVYDGSAGRLIWMVSWAAGNCTLFAANTTTLVTSWSQTNRLWWADEGSISCGFYKQALPFAVDAGIFAATRQGSVASAATAGGTAVEGRVYSGGALLANGQIPWYQMVSQICTVKIEAATQFYPVFSVSPYYDRTGLTDPTATGFVSDPSIELMRPRYDSIPTLLFDLLGRVGTDIVTRYPGSPLGINSSVYVASDRKMRLVYVADNLDGVARDGLVARYVDFDWSPWNPRQALLTGGQAVIAAAMPACWDGAEVTEFQPVRVPKLIGSATGGTGDALTGTYLFAAVVSWRDGAGVIHRSPPSNIVTLSPAGTAMRLWATVPVTYENRVTQGAYTVTIYASQDGGTVLYAQSTAETVASSTSYWHAFLSVFDPTQDALTPALYSDGSATQAKIPFAPNAAKDAKVIGDRLWLIDAERNRAYYSQPLSTEALSGIFPAMNPTQYIDFPAAAGTVVALENWKEAPIFFSSTGEWTVDGEGPDALNDPPYFAQPRQLSDIPCTDGDSVVLTPAGILFRSGNRFAIAGDQFSMLDDALASVDIVGAVVFRDQHEVVMVASNGTAWVFNYLKQAWTTWDANAFSSSGAISAVAQDPWTGKALYFSDSATALFSMDPTTTSTTAQMSMSTGWVMLGNPQEDCTLQNWILRSANGGTHGVSLAVAVDYQSDQPAKAYTSGEITSATSNGRYDLWAEPRDMPARAVKLTITETGATGAGMQPINVTYELIRNAGKKSSSLRQSGRK